MTYRGIPGIFSFTRMVRPLEEHHVSLQARMRRCSSLQGTALRPHRALLRIWTTTRFTPSNCGF
ncbi:hypothetical protein [Nitrosomonas sp. Nm33]|uniref:hypothetical protein n=1 Tax=Nitrosomonas sp. Nm33 TaxID=133724 RepID=UPI00115F99E3|nr:hypothetical protein [Nitrosomonas sp. Nm33]